MSAMVEFLQARGVPIELASWRRADTTYSPVAFTDIEQLTQEQKEAYDFARANTRGGTPVDHKAALELVSFAVNAENLAQILSVKFTGPRQQAALRLLTMVRVTEDSYYDLSNTALLRGTGYSRLSNTELSAIDSRLPSHMVDERSGYYAALYSNGGDYILANRGTQITGVSTIETLKDLAPNIAGIKGFASEQGRRALELGLLLSVALGPQVRLEFTGQSLGAYFAQLQTLRTGRPSTAINSSPGPDELALRAYDLNSKYADRISHHIVRGETVDFFQHNLAVKAAALGLRTVSMIFMGGPAPGWDLVPEYLEGSPKMIWAPGRQVGNPGDFNNIVRLNDHFTSGMLAAIGAWADGGEYPKIVR